MSRIEAVVLHEKMCDSLIDAWVRYERYKMEAGWESSSWR